ncbi:MAG: hypothetical protein ACRC5T_00170 [Cetobacterium sp.]
MTWKIMEMILKKPLEDVIDLITGNWNVKFCAEKRKFFSKEALIEAAKEKKVAFEENDKK